MKKQSKTSRLDHRKPIVVATIVGLLFLAALWFLKTYSLTPAADRVAPQTANGHDVGLRGSVPNHVAQVHSRIPVSRNQAGEMALKSYGKLPLSFEPNRGQADSRVKFLSRRSGYALFLTSTEAVLGLSKAGASVGSKYGPARTSSHRAASLGRVSLMRGISSPVFTPAVAKLGSNSTASGLHGTTLPEAQALLRMRLVDANPTPRLVALEELPGKSNYFIGRDPTKWRTNVPNYAKVKYQDVYPGVDLVYYGNEGRLEYDFVVARGADPRAIKLDISGAKRERIDSFGDLVLDMGNGEIRFHRPVVYQPVAALPENQGDKKFLEGRFVFLGHSQAGFEIAAYDSTRPLVIDPVLSYSTYLGGSGDETGGNGMQNIAVDPAGNAYIAGVTDSSDFPVTAGAFQTKFAGGGLSTQCGFAGDAFLTKVNARGDAVVYSTYLGGSSADCGEGIAVDSAGHAYIAGETLSTDFPVTPGVFQPACKSCSNGAPDTFAAKLTPNGSALVYSTYIGGSGSDFVPMITVDRSGNMYIQGSTSSVDFPTTQGAFQTTCAACAKGSFNTYVTKLNPEGTALVYSTYLGGSTTEFCGSQIAVDSEGSLYVDGMTFSTDFPTTPGAFQTTLSGGGPDAFVTKLNPGGTALAYSTFLGGSGGEFVSGLAVDDEGNAFVTGATSSSDFPTTPGAFQTNFGGGPEDAFVTKINPSGTALAYSTYLGGTGDDVGAGMAVDSHGNAYVGGFTSSGDFPTLNAFQPANAGGYDVFVTELNAAGDALVYSTYLGGSGDEFVGGIAFDSRRNVYVQGWTTSSDFLAVNPVQPQFGGGTYDALLAKISSLDAPGLGLSHLSVAFGRQPVGTTSPPQAVTVHSVGSQPLVIGEILTAPSSQFAQTNTCDQPLAPGEVCTISITFTPTGMGEAHGKLVVVANSQPASRRVSLTGGQTSPAVDQAPKSNGSARKARTLQSWRKIVIETKKVTH
jgi:hypothetical protein